MALRNWFHPVRTPPPRQAPPPPIATTLPATVPARSDRDYRRDLEKRWRQHMANQIQHVYVDDGSTINMAAGTTWVVPDLFGNGDVITYGHGDVIFNYDTWTGTWRTSFPRKPPPLRVHANARTFWSQTMTNKEAYGPAMEITDEGEAEVYFSMLVDEVVRETHYPIEKAETIVRQNLGYYAGYYNDETRARVERLFQCAHPVFGPIAEGKPTSEEAFAMGMELAAKQKREREQREREIAQRQYVTSGVYDYMKRGGV